jgi:hypothetical protein
MQELSSHNIGAGKGDHDRSPGWRDHYDEIDWGVRTSGHTGRTLTVYRDPRPSELQPADAQPEQGPLPPLPPMANRLYLRRQARKSSRVR